MVPSLTPESSPVSPAVDALDLTAAPLRRLMGLAIFVLILVVIGRLVGPSDLHDQTQPKTAAYTTNIALYPTDWTRWILPRENEMYPATKPPLYNWIAAPFVALTDGRYEIAHRMPSILAFAALALLLARIGKQMDPGMPTAALAVMAIAANYAIFKLAFLIRPDMLLTLWLIVGWWAATFLLSGGVKEEHRPRWRIMLWLAVGLAALTKGPPALVIPLYIVVLPWWYRPGLTDQTRGGESGGGNGGAWHQRSREALRVTGAAWGIPLAALLFGTWLGLAFLADPAHVKQVLIYDEVIGRVLGTGAEGTKEGPWDLLRTSLHMPLYFITRYLPWSILFCGALIDLFGKTKESHHPRGFPPANHPARVWLIGSLVYIGLVIVFFSLAAGKRADYIASAFGPASLVVAWSLVNLGFRPAQKAPLAIGLATVLMVSGLTIHESYFGFAVDHPVADAIRPFAKRVKNEMAEEPGVPLEFYRCGRAPLQTIMHRSQTEAADAAALAARCEDQPLFFLVTRVGVIKDLRGATELAEWSFIPLASSETVTGSPGGSPYQVLLYLARRRD